MKSQDLKRFNLPDTPGVYYFLGKQEARSKKPAPVLYVGKATSLKDRVKSYFSKDILLTRGPLIEKMLEEAESIRYETTDSVLEAMILEVSEIKKIQPPYNVKEKDDKSYNYVVITKEDFPKILTKRGRELELEARSPKLEAIYGPFPHARELKEALKIIRKIFPYRDEKCKLPKEGKAPKPCFNAQIGLCPGPCAGWVSKTEYRKTIRHIKMFFEAKKPALIRSLEKEMRDFAKKEKFEQAERVKKTIYALEHIQDIALLKEDYDRDEVGVRIEAYDIAHLSGTNVVGVMTVVEDGEVAKSQYRKFKIREDKNDDTGNLKEVLRRRLGHSEWTLPNIIVIDGGVGQVNSAKEVLKERGFNIEVMAVVKDDKHKARELLGKKNLVAKHGKSALLANAEAHRFAIGYHRKLRSRGFRI